MYVHTHIVHLPVHVLCSYVVLGKRRLRKSYKGLRCGSSQLFYEDDVDDLGTDHASEPR